MKPFALIITLFWLGSIALLAQNTTITESKSKSVTPFAGTPADSVVLPRPRTSPVAIAQYKSGDAYVRVVYGQPLKRGREIFGVLQPFGELWRTGANEATEITFTKDVRLGGKPLRAGTYTLFTIPNQNQWTIILNSELGQWGAFSYNAAKNILTTDVPSTTIKELYEAFTIKFDETKTGAELHLLWDKTKVTVPLLFEK